MGPGAGKDLIKSIRLAWSHGDVFPSFSCWHSQRGNVFLCVTLPQVSGSSDGKNGSLVDLLVIELCEWAREGLTTPVPLGHLIVAWPESTKS